MFLRVSDPEGDDCVSVVRRVIGHDADDDVLVSVIPRETDFEFGGD